MPLSLRSFAVFVPLSLLAIGCDGVLLDDRDTTPVGVSAALTTAPTDTALCLPVSAFGSDMDLIDACMACAVDAVCTAEQIDAGCCTEPTSSAPTPGAGIGVIGAGAAAGGLAAPLEPRPLPLGTRGSG